MDEVIRLRSAVALAGRFPVLAGADLDVGRSEVVLLRGANGAGKTSLLRACAGLLRVVAGEARVLGQDLVADPRAVRRRVGLFGHQANLYEDLTVGDNLAFFVRAAGADRSAIAPAMERLGLQDRLARTPVRSLSAGQRRRVALAILLARSAELWLLDEPHAGLDAGYRDLLDGLVATHRSRGGSVVIASHELERAVPLADRVLEVAGGVVVAPASKADGPRPASPALEATGVVA